MVSALPGFHDVCRWVGRGCLGAGVVRRTPGAGGIPDSLMVTSVCPHPSVLPSQTWGKIGSCVPHLLLARALGAPGSSRRPLMPHSALPSPLLDPRWTPASLRRPQDPLLPAWEESLVIFLPKEERSSSAWRSVVTGWLHFPLPSSLLATALLCERVPGTSGLVPVPALGTRRLRAK